ncbi:MAG: SDR family oxidoreductase [bacterium]|nr:SDR family oxidoreductase [bacterium]MDE0289314.1 SDR family oxidoreductase [bacterium]MDE0440276.1 SDR family oxidoreductase [bacterium]
MILPDTGLQGKTALVTGGASGIGLGIAEALAAERVDLAIVSRNPDPGAISHLESLGVSVAALRADVSVEGEVCRTVAQAERLLGPIDLLVANAATARKEPVTKVTTDGWERSLRTNLTGTMWVCRQIARKMVSRRAGSILVIGSTAQYHRAPGEAAYHASKAGLAAYAETLAVELAPHGIRVNMLVPGSFVTRLNPVATGPVHDRLLAEIPLGRQGRPAECGPAAVFLLSDRLASYVTGAQLVVSGGLHLRPHVRVDWSDVERMNIPETSSPD